MNRKINIVIIFLILTLSEVVTAQTKWEWISGGTPNSNIVKCKLLDQQLGYAIDLSGLIFKTTDGGASFKLQHLNSQITVSDFCFVDSLNGWVTGQTGELLKTTNGGQDWQNLTGVKYHSYYGVSFVNRDIGWLLHENNLLKSTNGGRTWEAKYTQNNISTGEIHALNINTTFFINNNTFFTSKDGGANWSSLNFPVSTILKKIRFINETTGWISFTRTGNEDSSGIMKTTNGGRTWEVLSVNRLFSQCSDICFKDSLNGMAAIKDGIILQTNDGGIHWAESYTISNRYFRAVSLSGSTAIACGPSGLIVRTNNSGVSWERVLPQPTTDYNSIKFFDGNTGLIVGSAGKLLRTSDAGRSWLNINSGTTAYLNSISLLSSGHGWISGSNGTLLMTNDKGATWQNLNTGVNNNLTSVCFTSPTTGWVTTADGNILNTTDGGLNWITQLTLPYKNLLSVYFINSQKGWVSGYRIICRTTNGGRNWVYSNVSTVNELYSISFCDDRNGIAAGNTGYVLRTTDGGGTWAQTTMPGSYSLRSVHYETPSEVWLTGESGHIYTSTDGGQNWVSYVTNLEANINSLSMAENYGYAVGTLGTILKAKMNEIVVSSPKANEELPVGYSRRINWFSSSTAFVNIDYSTDGGLTWINIASRYPANLKTYPWIIPNTPSDNCFIRVQDADNTALSDTLNGAFSIVMPKLKLLKPIGNELWPKMVRDEISWKAIGSSKINILLTRNNGISWTTIASNYPAGAEAYSIDFSNYDTSSFCRIKLVDVEESAVVDSSANLFRISPQIPLNVVVFNPINGTINVLQPFVIQWYNVLNAEWYELLISGNADFSTIEVRDTSIRTNGFRCPLLQHYKTYYWKIRACNISGAGPYRNGFFSTALITIPAPTNLTATRTVPGTVELNWQDNSSNEEIFSIYRKNGPANSSEPFTYLNSMIANVTSCTDGTLSDTATYSYVVYGKNQNIFSQASNTVTVYPPAAIGEGKEIPKDFELYQNYPNPFNPVTTIRYGVPYGAFVTLEVYDALGRRVAAPVNENKEAGYYNLNFSSSLLSSGVYVCVLTSVSSERNQPVKKIKKMTYLR